MELTSSHPSMSKLPLFYSYAHLSPSRRIYYYDSPLSPEKKNWLFCHPDVPSLHHDCDLITGVVLAKQRICSC